MNQTFNLKRFLRYTRFILSMNRWYYGILFVACVLPASVLSVCGQANFARGLLYFSVMLTLALPSIDNVYVRGHKMREIAIPVSWLEKLIIEVAVRHWTLVIPFTIHAVAVAIGINELTCYFADGFEISKFLFLLVLTNGGLICCLAADNSWFWRGFNTGEGKEKLSFYASVWVAICFGFMGVLEGYSYSSIPTTIPLTIIIAFFVTTVVFYRKRKGY